MKADNIFHEAGISEKDPASVGHVRFSDTRFRRRIENMISEETYDNMKWALSVFNEWRSARIKNGDNIPELHLLDAETIGYNAFF